MERHPLQHPLNWPLLRSASSPSSLLDAFARSFPPPPPLQTHHRFDLNHAPYFQQLPVPVPVPVPSNCTLLTLALPSLSSQQAASYGYGHGYGYGYVPCMHQGDPAPRRGRRPIPVQERKDTRCKVPKRWTYEEDRELERLVREVGEQQWSKIGNMIKGRKGKQCRERWNNHLRPDITKHAEWTKEEEETIVEILKKDGTKWSKLGKILQGRTENMIKNHWNSTKRKVISNGTFLESSPLQRYIGLASGCLPWNLPIRDDSSSVGSTSQGTATATTTTTDDAMEEAPRKEPVLINFFV